MRQSRWQRYKQIEQKLKHNERITGELEDLCSCSEKRFKEIICNGMNLSSGHYYEYLFSCILFSVLGEQFKKADINTDITEHYDAIICGTPCDFTMQLSEKSKMTYKNIILIRFPHKSYHKGGRVKKEIVNIILNTVRDHDIPIEPDDNRLASLNKRIAKYAY